MIEVKNISKEFVSAKKYMMCLMKNIKSVWNF